MTTGEPPVAERQRIDKWLFFTRMVKSRSLAQTLVEAGHVAVNGRKVHQPSHAVRTGDRIELTLERRDIVLVVRGAGKRRGPFEEARLLYEDLTPPPEATPRLSAFEQAQRQPGSGRPTKRERRALDNLLSDFDGTGE
ncbi:RNA-binding S4 domain-containing protein [Rhizobiaceae bacterium BDR2-2]|uniref:RNA-binding S4 domain-containing protein n=1 Tax=Ectorhizobium quercum TaxID=2965071 RepID=A0AAE3SYA6_9HYPH|nr:RNA-binding S4 domain-containing protein [Ectorhizobium quercum]MCX8999340.1 RNA-binding S4 domain-containing protein [Ectorhizobium quercum]